MPVTRSFFQRIPFIRIASLFLIGVLINHYLNFDLQWMGIVVTILLSILIFLWHNSNFSAVKTQNYLLSLCILISGVFYPKRVTEKHSLKFDQKDYYLAEICQKPAEKARTYQTILRIQSRLLPKPEKVIAYFSKESFDTTLVTGDQIVLLARPQEIKNMGNPFEFDYRKMMSNKGIYYSLYLTPEAYHKTGIKINRIKYLAEKVRDKLIALLSATKIEKEERSVISALTLGYRTELDPETMDYFVNTGTIHVLSVSGLHVALIFFILSFLLSGINKGKVGTLIYPAIMILFLWIYSFITGFSPSVQRSTVMFTFVIIGSTLRRPVNIYNSLSASALVLILLDTNVLFDIGFQLSYLAVFGIVLLQPPMAELIQLKNKILKWLWTMFTVSIAAQLITFPLSILYFNQFPNLFWLSNYFVIPGTTILIWLSFGFFVLYPIPAIANILAELIQFITDLMLRLLKWMSELPYAVSEGILYSQVQTWILYGLIAAFVIYGFTKNKTWLFGGLVLLITFQINALWTKSDLFNQKTVYVYNSKNTLIHLINNRSNYVLSYGQNSITDQEMNMIQNVCNHLKIEKPKFIKPVTMNKFESSDLKINDQTINFLNCRIDMTDKLKFNIQSPDLVNFRINNPELASIKITNTILPGENLSLKKSQLYSIEVVSKFKEVVCLNLN
ncbi:MAG: competence protein ComEC family protein [Prolixibacteraceae bacterium]|nr:competence protein ComEC family protein [Prolixibacteraceae bacterium]